MITTHIGDNPVWQVAAVTSFNELRDLQRIAGGIFGTTYRATHRRFGLINYKKLRNDSFIDLSDRSVQLALSLVYLLVDTYRRY